ncbi:hypothetical protein YC2023_022656 [Brassica napus]
MFSITSSPSLVLSKQKKQTHFDQTFVSYSIHPTKQKKQTHFDQTFVSNKYYKIC